MAGESTLRKTATIDFLRHQGKARYSTGEEDEEPGELIRLRSGGAAQAYSDGRATTLVCRDEEIVALDALLRDCWQGKGTAAVIRGPIASGKTTLLHVLARQAVETGAIFLSAVASRAERELPLGILDQLFRSDSLPAAISQRINSLIEDHALIGASPESAPETITPVMAHVFEGPLKVLVELAEGHPVVIAVDDLQHADVASLQCLSYLARRVAASRILMVLTECTQGLPADRLLHAEIFRQGNCRCIPLAPLPPSGVAGLLSQHLDPRAAQRLASSCHAITGGNPLLVKALGDDTRASGCEPAKLIPRSSFRSAVITCLSRYEPDIVKLAQAVAVFDQSATPSLLAELLEISAESATHGLNALSVSGLLDSGQFRHEAARQAVLEHMAADERAAMHGRAALTLYRTGAAPVVLASHLVDAHRVGEGWTIPVLHEAAERAIADGHASRGIAYLRRAESECVDDRQRAAIRFALTCAEWPINPEGAARHLAALVIDAREGRLDDESMGNLAYFLLWVGDTGKAAEILSMLDIARKNLNTRKKESQAYYIYFLQNFLCPEPGQRSGQVIESGKTLSPAEVRSRPDGTSALHGVGADNDATPVIAERVLQERGFNDPALASVTTALMALICEDMLDRAAFWCNALMQESEKSCISVFQQAVLTGFWSIVETRLGNLAAAEDHARTSLALLSGKAWGIAIGVPLSSLLLTAIATRRHADAAACLRVPVPEAMFETPYGLLYLYARGEYYLATGCTQEALADFTECGKRMVTWGLDHAGLVPWRAKAAEAHLAIGNDLKARELSREQLAQIGSRSSRTRGISLRALALSIHPSKRPAVLRESIEILRDSGAWLELAYSFNELSNAHLALGEYSRAHWAARQARTLAERCGAQALQVTLGKTDLDLPEPGDGAHATLLARLSDAEQRVAMLAACGYTNIQIAHKLYITVSTVEQHLTRVYRKLGVAGRAELPIDI